MRPRTAALLAAALIASPLMAGVRLTYPVGGVSTEVAWPQNTSIRYEVDPAVAAKYGPTVDKAFAAWTAVTDANVKFESAGIGNVKWGQDGVNSVTTLDSLFKDQGFLALTTNWYDSKGVMTEADIQVDSTLVGSSYPALPTIEHEIGHLLGLDHSAVLSSIMYPYVAKDMTPSLDSDDRIAISGVYPKYDPSLVGATLTGRVVNDTGGVFAAQVVAMNERGEPVATSLTGSSGDFTLEGVPAGTYRVYAEPLDGPVEPRNLTGVYSAVKVTAFPTRFASSTPMRVDSGKVYGNLTVNVAGTPARLNPKFIGVSPSASADFSLCSSPVMLKAGSTVSLAVGGDGFTSGMTTFEVLNPAFRRVSDFHYASNFAWATFEIAPDAAATSAVIQVTSGNETAMLTGALRLDGATRGRAVRH
jgi:hypothetical protein